MLFRSGRLVCGQSFLLQALFIYHLFHVEYQVLEKEEEEENKRREFERRVQEAEYRGRVWQERAQAAEERERATQQELFELKRRFQAITTH